MTIIELNKRYIAIPTSWNELSQRQLLAIIDSLHFKQYTAEQCRLKLFKIICSLSYFQFFRTRPSQMAEYLYLTDFLVEAKTELTKNLIPEYRGFYGPAGDFDNLQMKEMAKTDFKFMQWANDKENICLLDDIVSLLYRKPKNDYDFKKNPDGDPRVPFNENISEWNARRFIKKWPVKVKLAIAYWYDSCRHELASRFSEVFGGSGNDNVSKYGLVSCMLSVAESHALGDFTSVENHYVNTVLMHIDDSIRKAKAQEKAMKK